ncbi:LuxR family transcriptional regulator [Actinocrispum sp. NPDC049592]|uniref:ATP-binding protein n=1 Tax=Actinocrispum sp. NPDC049592 TaxID=3154835 RepID=UPI003415E9D2
MTVIGRDAELGRLRALVERARLGQGGALVVCGPAGIGKSALLAELVRVSVDVQPVVVAGAETERHLGFAGLHRLLRPFLDRLDRLAPPQLRALRVVFGLADGAEPDRFLVGLAALTLLSEAASVHPVLCVVDDAQWLDHETAQVVGFVARRLLADRVAIVVATRQLSAFGGLDVLSLNGLPADAARELVGQRIDPAVAERIMEQAQGNPLGLIELTAGLSEGQRTGAELLPEVLPLSRRLEEQFRARVRELPEAVRQCLLVVATEPAGDAALLHEAAARLNLDPAGFGEAVAAGLLSVPGLGFRHPLMRSAVYHGAEPADRRRVHGVFADIGRLGEDRVAWHRAAAVTGPDEGVARELEEVAARVSRRGGHASAAALLLRAADLSDQVGSRVSRLSAAANAEIRAGATGRARPILDAAERLATGPAAARVQWLRGMVSYASGDLDAAVPALMQAAAGMRRYDAALARQTLHDAMAACFVQGAYRVRLIEAARAIVATPGSADLFDVILDRIADFVLGVPDAAEAIRRTLAPLTTERAEGLRLFGVACMASTVIGDMQLTCDLADGWMLAARTQHAYLELARALNYAAVYEWHRGSLARAEALSAELREIEAAYGLRLSPGEVLVRCLRADEGAEAAAMELAGQAWIGLFAQWGLGVLYLGAGRAEQALPHLLAACPPGSYWVPHGEPDLIEAAVRAGDLELARDTFERYRAGSGPSPLVLGLISRCQAMVGTDDDAIAEHFALSAKQLEQAGSALQMARTQLLHGEWLRRRRHRQAAGVQLRAAHEQFSRIGATAFAARARAELAAAGIAAAGPAPHQAVALTAQERRIAALAAEGATNREIGARLFLSPNTVDYHLRKVFQKLGLTSRRQLTGRPLD